jgi:dimethyladenosine transferase 1
LTRSILKQGAKKVIVVEKDPRFIPSLEGLAQAADGRLFIVQGDMLKVDEARLLREFNTTNDPVKIMGNLPFNVATSLLLKWLRLVPEKKGPFEYGKVPMVLLFQREVADVRSY